MQRHDIRVAIFCKDQPYGSLPAVTCSGHALRCWVDSDGNTITSSTIANKHRNLTAVWSGSCAYGDNCPSKNFTDVSADFWAHDAIDYVVVNNMFKGTTNTTFSPNTVMTRGMLVTELIEEGKAKIQVLRSTDKWYGVTYREDKPLVVEAIARKTAEGQYPETLWYVILPAFH